MITNAKTPSIKEKIMVYEKFLEAINQSLRASNMQALKDLIQKADTWAYIKTSKVKGVCPQEHKKILNEAFWSLTNSK